MTYRFMAICILVLVLPALIVPWNIDPRKEHLLPYGYQNRKETTKVQNNKIKLLTISFLCMCLRQTEYGRCGRGVAISFMPASRP